MPLGRPDSAEWTLQGGWARRHRRVQQWVSGDNEGALGALWEGALSPSCPVNPELESRHPHLRMGLWGATLVCPTPPPHSSHCKEPLQPITHSWCYSELLRFLKLSETSTLEQDASAAENPETCRHWAPAPGVCVQHTFCIMKTNNSLNISALHLEQLCAIFIFYSGNEILSISSVIKEDAKLCK